MLTVEASQSCYFLSPIKPLVGPDPGVSLSALHPSPPSEIRNAPRHKGMALQTDGSLS